MTIGYDKENKREDRVIEDLDAKYRAIGFNRDGKKAGQGRQRIHDWNAFGKDFLTSGLDKYMEFCERQIDGEDLKKPQLDFMDRWERMLEYFKPKLARREHIGEITTKSVVILPQKDIRPGLELPKDGSELDKKE